MISMVFYLFFSTLLILCSFGNSFRFCHQKIRKNQLTKCYMIERNSLFLTKIIQNLERNKKINENNPTFHSFTHRDQLVNRNSLDFESHPLIPQVNTIINSALDKKANYIKAYEISKLTSMATFIIIIEAQSKAQISAIKDAIEDNLLAEHNLSIGRFDGKPISGWCVLDYEEIIVHIMNKELRNYYKLEKKWGDKDNEYKFNIDLLPNQAFNHEDYDDNNFQTETKEEDEEESIDDWTIN